MAKLHRQLDVGRLQKAKKNETEILRLLHKAETGATLDFEVRSESLQCTSFWNLDRALNGKIILHGLSTLQRKTNGGLCNRYI